MGKFRTPAYTVAVSFAACASIAEPLGTKVSTSEMATNTFVSLVIKGCSFLSWRSLSKALKTYYEGAPSYNVLVPRRFCGAPTKWTLCQPERNVFRRSNHCQWG